MHKEVELEMTDETIASLAHYAQTLGAPVDDVAQALLIKAIAKLPKAQPRSALVIPFRKREAA